MCQSCNFVNVYTKSCKHLLNVYMNMVASNRNQMIFSYNNSIMVSNSHNLQLDQSIIRWQQS